MDIIYEVIDLKPQNIAGSRSTNRQRVKNVKSKYRSILNRLAQGKPAGTKDEERVRKMFGPDASAADFQKATYHLRCQTGQKDRFRAGIIRSGAYIDKIKSIFRESGLPEELAYLPHVESSYHPRAHSKSGAAGIWQFTRATGKKYLQMTSDLDERWDPLAASYGAARLLRHNYRKFKNWPLAITAYNHGTAGVLKAQRNKGNYVAIFKHYRSRSFRFASRNFYSEFLAACRVAQNPREYFGELALDKPLRFEEVKLKGYVSLPRLIERFQLDRSEIYRLNPALSKAVRKGRRYVPKGFHLRLPVMENVVVTAELESLYKVKAPVGNTYTVRKGDTAGRIARLHHIRVEDLIIANALDRRARIYPKQKLKIPAYHDRPSGNLSRPSVMTAQTDGATTPRANISVEGDWQTYGHPLQSEVACPEAHPESFAVQRVYHHKGRQVGIVHVRVEETIGHFAEWLDVPARDIRRLNGIRYGRALRLNQKIRVPLHQISKKEFEARRHAFHQGLAEDFFVRYRVAGITTYTVKKGDNIWKLSHRDFNVPVWLIKRFNSETDFSALTPSRRLVIPVVNERPDQSA
jgi:membrane-bound lytic murein transglycosylase D